VLTIAAIWLTISTPGLRPERTIAPVPGYDWMAPKLRKGEPAPPPLPNEQVVAEFLAFVAQHSAYDDEAKAFVASQRETTAPEDLGEFITLAYSVLAPEFKRGLELIEQDKSGEAADVFEKLAESDDPYLAVAAANFGATALIDLELIERCHALLNRVLEAHKPVEKLTTAADHFRFMLGYCQVHVLDYQFAYGTFEDFLKNHPNAPERLRTTAQQILTELSRRAPGRIGDIRDLLTYARRKLKTGQTDETLLQKQEEAVALLETLIDEAEQQEQNQGEGEGQGQSGRRGAPRGSKKPGGGAAESTLPTGGGREGKLRKSIARPGEMWGKMLPREREEVMQTLQKQFPSQYRDLLEQYYKQLSKEAPES